MSQVDLPQLIPDPIAAAQRDDGSLSTKTTPINSRVQIIMTNSVTSWPKNSGKKPPIHCNNKRMPITRRSCVMIERCSLSK